jgi:hypothetical protein
MKYQIMSCDCEWPEELPSVFLFPIVLSQHRQLANTEEPMWVLDWRSFSDQLFLITAHYANAP